MAPMHEQIRQQAREIEELKQQRAELRRLNALLEDSTGITELKGKLEEASAGVEERVRAKDEEMEVMAAHHNGEVENLRVGWHHEVLVLKEQVGNLELQLREARQHAVKSDQRAAVINQQLCEARQYATSLNHQLTAGQQHSANLERQLAAARQQGQSYFEQAKGFHRQLEATKQRQAKKDAQMEGLREEISMLKHKNDAAEQAETQKIVELENQVKKANEEVEEWENSMIAILEDHSTTIGELEKKHAQEIEQLQGLLQQARQELEVQRQSSARSTPSNKRKAVPADTSSASVRRTRSKRDMPLSDLAIPQ